MSLTDKQRFVVQASDAFKWLFDKNMITHRDGNVAQKQDYGTYFVSASGIDKTDMDYSNFVEVNPFSQVVDGSGLKPSIETQAHISALEATSKKVSIHVHSPKTVALFASKQYQDFLNPYTFNTFVEELETEIKTEWPELFRHTKLGTTVPFLDPGSKELHKVISDSFLDTPDIIVLQRHGVLAVGDSVQEALEHICRLEHISSILLDIEKVK